VSLNFSAAAHKTTFVGNRCFTWSYFSTCGVLLISVIM